MHIIQTLLVLSLVRVHPARPGPGLHTRLGRVLDRDVRRLAAAGTRASDWVS